MESGSLEKLWAKQWMTFLLWMTSFLLIAEPLHAECYLVTGSGYRSIGGASRLGPYPTAGQCEGVRQQYKMGGQCVCDESGSGGSGSGGSSGYGAYTWEGMYMQTMQNLMQNFMDGFQNEMKRQQELQAQEQQQREWQLQQRYWEEKEREEKENQRRQEAAREKERVHSEMLSQLRGLDSQGLKPRDLGSDSDLQVREVEDVFGTKTLKPTVQPAEPRIALASSLQHINNCAAYLVMKASRAASFGDFSEAAFLSNEAADLFSGTKTSPSVVCPEVASVEAGPVPEWEAKQEEFKKRMIFLSKLYGRANEQAEGYRNISKSLTKAEQEEREAKGRVEVAKTRLDQLEVQESQQPDSPSASAMDEALAALKEAERTYDETKKHLAELSEDRKKMEEKLGETRKLSELAVKDPKKIDELMGRLTK